MHIRIGTAADDVTVIQHYLALWDSYGTPREHYVDHATASVQTFLNEGRSRLELATFLAEVDGEPVGSSSCKLQVSPYPAVVKPEHRLFGYIWHVFVKPEFGHRGIGRALTEAAVQHLRELGCTTAVLNASDAGERLYASMGFKYAKEMRLTLRGL